jgi:hypothetical protein
MTRTFSRGAWEEAQAAWKDGKFSDEWKPYRHQAAMRGMIYPPEGTRFDSWDDDEPSQRAILIRAIRETPDLLATAIERSRTWGNIVAILLRARDDWREEVRRAEPLRDGPDEREAVVALKAIIERIADS